MLLPEVRLLVRVEIRVLVEASGLFVNLGFNRFIKGEEVAALIKHGKDLFDLLPAPILVLLVNVCLFEESNASPEVVHNVEVA